MLNQAGHFFDLEMYDEALRMGKQSLSILKRTLPETHAHTVEAMYNLAVTYAYLYKCEEALVLFEKLLTLGCPEKTLKSRKWIKDIQLHLGSKAAGVPEPAGAEAKPEGVAEKLTDSKLGVSANLDK